MPVLSYNRLLKIQEQIDELREKQHQICEGQPQDDVDWEPWAATEWDCIQDEIERLQEAWRGS